MRRARMPLAAIFATAVVAIVAPSAPAAGGALDGAFDHRGMVLEPYGTLSANVASVVQRDGRIVTAGEAELSPNRFALMSTRLLPNGRLDTSYGNAGRVILTLKGSAGGSAIALLRNGDILIGGGGKAVGTQPLSFMAVKLLPNGQIDKSFGNQGVTTVPIGVAALANAIAVQPDGRIVLGGTAVEGSDRFAVARLNADGSVDRSFGNHGVTVLGQDAGAWGMGIRPDGSIVLAGVVTPNGLAGGLVSLLNLASLGDVGARLTSGQQYMAAAVTSTGQPDPSFGSNGVLRLGIGSKAFCTAVAVEPDGKVLLAGNALTNTLVSATVRLMPDGSVDQSFAANGYSEQPVLTGVNAVAMQPDGKILLATTGPTVIRLDPSGVPDAGFGNGGITRIGGGHGNAANGVAYDPVNGDVVLTGVATVSKRIEASVVVLRGS